MQDTPEQRAFFSRLNARQYETELVPRIFRPWAEQLLAWLELPAESQVLDLACGTGVLARTLHRQRPDLQLHALDLSDDMLEIASQCCPEVKWQQGNALQLPWPEQSLDAVCCQQGLQFVPERPAVLREIQRVLKPGGQLLAACWQPIEDNGAYAALLQWAQRQGWQGFAGFMQQIFSWPLQQLEQDVRACGLEMIRQTTHCQPSRFPSLQAFAHVFTRVPPLQPDWDALNEREQQLSLDLLQTLAAQWIQDDGTLEFPMCSGLVLAKRPVESG